MIALDLEFEIKATGSGTLITIFSMAFTIISIFLSGAEYLFSHKAAKMEHIMIISYTVDSPYFANMKEGAFLFKVMFKPRKIVHAMYTLLEINRSNIERLMPLQLKNGAIFTFFIEYGNQIKYNKIANKMNNAIADKALESKFCQIYTQSKGKNDYKNPFTINSNSLTIKQMEPPLQSKCSKWIDSQFGVYLNSIARHKTITTTTHSELQLHSQVGSTSDSANIGGSSPTVASTSHSGQGSDIEFDMGAGLPSQVDINNAFNDPSKD